nr:long-chain fatty acid--CoA ligase [Marinicella sp. W31]MDC2876989.1 long-chain fatty acid--CoA ligase [Marinicella sp. W31]
MVSALMEGGQVLPDFLDDAVRRFSDRAAVEFFDRTWTYGQIDHLVDRFSRGLAGLGVKRAHVSVSACPILLFGSLFFAVLKAGGVVVNYNPLYTSRELLAQIRDSGTEVMITLDLQQVYKGLGPIIADAELKHVIVCSMAESLPTAKGLLFRLFKRADRARIPRDAYHISYDAVLRKGDQTERRAVEITPQDIAVLQYTGGTTGIPKGAMLSHTALISNARQMLAQTGEDVLTPGEEVIVGVLPFFHVFAMTVCMLYAIEIGAVMLLVPRFNRDDLIALMEKRRPTLLPAVPTIYGAINAVAATRRIDLTSLKICVSGGAPLPLEVRTDFEKLTGCKLSEGYGLTECSPVVSVNPFDGRPARPGSAGLALPGTVLEIRDSENPAVVLPKGVKGELWVRGPQVMSGYWNKPDDTAYALRDGAFRTGDVGYIDEDGYLFLVDRLKDLIICGGYNVYPRLIEEALYEHEDVAEAIVIGVRDEYRGEAPKAFVALRPDSTVTVEELHAFLKPRLSKIELPRAIEIRESLPKTMIGKLSKKELIEEERNTSHHAAEPKREKGQRHVDA